MPLSNRRRGGGEPLNPWPGYVDALSTLLMVIIFVLLVFVLAQAFLGVALSGKDRALDKLGRQVAELTDMLSLERGRTHELQLSMAGLGTDLKAAQAARDTLANQLAALQADAAQAASQRDTLRAERDRLSASLADAQLQAQSAGGRVAQMQARLDAAQKGADAGAQQAADAGAQLAAAQRQIAALREQAAALDKTVSADRDTIQARLSDLARLSDQAKALAALRDELLAQVRDAAARATTAEQARAALAAQLADESKLSDSGRAQIALLNQQLTQLRAQMQSVAAALDLAASQGRDKDAQIAALGQKLNVALAAKVEELQQYRSEFFGRLREVLSGRPGIQVVGDRFVFQSEVLFPVGAADLSTAGQDEVRALAGTLKGIIPDIPRGVNWILRVDGHADRLPVTNSGFASNWELSSERAINVVKLLIAQGIPAQHLAATAFADFQPLDSGDTAEAFARNRRIELRLTDR